eukprot:6075895-Prymnesium_polylepis.1
MRTDRSLRGEARGGAAPSPLRRQARGGKFGERGALSPHPTNSPKPEARARTVRGAPQQSIG